jgi:hypothetical protein
MTKGPTGRLAARIADAYAMPLQTVTEALAECSIETEDVAGLALERHGDRILIVQGGDVLADIDMGEDLPPIATACDTLDPYGDRTDMLHAASVHDPFVPRVPPGPLGD